MKRAILVTGCNRGFGRAILECLLKKYKTADSVDFYLISRLGSASKDVAIEGYVHLIDWKVDFLVKEQVENIKNLVKQMPDYNEVHLFSNAGALGKLGLSHQIDLESIEQATKINYYGPVSLVSALVDRYSPTSKLLLINISSLAAIQAFKGWSTYCSTKAAASLFFKCIATEHDPKVVKVLNYAPGPLDTRMQNDIRYGMIGDEFKSDREYWINLKQSGGLVNPLASASVLLDIIQEDKFESGAHIDYYDILATSSSK